MPSQLIVITAIAILQWLCVTASVGLIGYMEPTLSAPSWFYVNAIFFGNMQIICVIWLYRVINKYIKF